jgi:hypothetical protein
MASINSLGRYDASTSWLKSGAGDKSAEAGNGDVPAKAAGSAADAAGGGLGDPLSSDVQSVLLQNQSDGTASSSSSADGTAGTGQAIVPSGKEIGAADVLALDIVQRYDKNHNGSLSSQEAVSSSVGEQFGSLDKNHTGEVTASEIAGSMLQGTFDVSA